MKWNWYILNPMVKIREQKIIHSIILILAVFCNALSPTALLT